MAKWEKPEYDSGGAPVETSDVFLAIVSYLWKTFGVLILAALALYWIFGP